MQEAQVQSLVRERRSHILCSVAKEKKVMGLEIQCLVGF